MAWAMQLMCDRAQEGVAQFDRQRPGGGHHGRQFIVGKADGRHGRAPLAESCAANRLGAFSDSESLKPSSLRGPFFAGGRGAIPPNRGDNEKGRSGALDRSPDIARRVSFSGLGTFSSSALVLLCHKFRCLFRAAQHGQRESVVARAATNLRRIVAIEFGTWRSGRNGGSSGLVTFA
jgi:hypothetical protein